MRNKYNYGELVKISGMGKNFGEVKNRLGFIIRRWFLRRLLCRASIWRKRLV